MNFDIINETENEIDKKRLKSLINYILKKEKLSNIEFNIIFVSNEKIKELNNEYRNINKETDVLSFALEDNKKIVYNNIRVLGDIYIAYNVAKKQAIQNQHKIEEEVIFLIIHGLLHLLGYDHDTIEKEQIMFNKQKEMFDYVKQLKTNRKKTHREVIQKQFGFKRFKNSIINSLAGLKYAYTNEQSLFIHILLMTIVVSAGIYYKIDGVQWVLVLFAASVIIVAELLNTAIEATVDLITEDFHPLAKVAKDCASAAVFIISIVAGCVWLYVFIPKIISTII